MARRVPGMTAVAPRDAQRIRFSLTANPSSLGVLITTTLALDVPRPGVALLRLNRPARLNAVNGVMRDELLQTLAALATDATVHAVVLTGSGRGFCSGIDVRDFGPGTVAADAPAIDRLRFQESMAALPTAVRDLPQPVIAAVNGPVRRRGPGAVPGL